MSEERKEQQGLNLSSSDIIRIIESSGKLQPEQLSGKLQPEPPKPLWCGFGCGGHLLAMPNLEEV